jgi:hypothetical protein
MATRAEKKAKLTSEINLLQARINIATQASTAKKNDRVAQNALTDLQEQLGELNRQLTKINAADQQDKDTAKQAEDIKAGKYVPEQARTMDQSVLQEFKNAGFQITDESFAMGGALSTMQVYTGETKSKAYVGSQMADTVKLNVKFSNTVKQDFWKDAAIRNKVKAAMASSGATNVNDITAFDQWGAIVDKAAALYAGGQGPKLTPMDVLNITVSSNAAANLPRLDIQMQDPNVLREIIRSNYKSTIGRLPNSDEEEARMSELQKIINKGSTTTTKTVGGKKVTTSTPGFTQAGAEALVTEKAKKSAPVDYELKQTSNFNNLLTKWMGSGI